MVESEIAIRPEIGRKLDQLHDLLARMAVIHAKVPEQGLKKKILQTISKWEKRGTLWDKWCPN